MHRPPAASTRKPDLTDLGLDRPPDAADGPMLAPGMRAGRGAIRLPFGSRAEATELLDGGHLSAADVDANLADLARLNALPGGRRASIAAIRRLVTGVPSPRVLDAGTGRADMAVAFVAAGWATTALDINPQVLRVAVREAGGVEGLTLVHADVAQLPFGDGAFDVAHCSLLAHHFGPDELVARLRELRRVSGAGVVVNDVRRGAWPYVASAVAMTALARSRVTMADGLTSVRRGYTLDELDALAARAGLVRTWRSSRWWPRVATAYVPR